MLLCELLEMVLQDFLSVLLSLVVRLGLYLEQKAFAQIPRSNTNRVEFLNDAEKVFQFIYISFYIEPERDIVRKGFEIGTIDDFMEIMPYDL